MPHFGPHNVIWHSTPGDCRWKYAIVTYPGDPRENGIDFTLPIPTIAGAGPLTTLVVSAVQPGTEGQAGFLPNIQGVRGYSYTDGDGVLHTASVSFNNSRAQGFVCANVPRTGGAVTIRVGTFWLNFIFGWAVCSANGFAIAMLIDPQLGNEGDPTIASMVWDIPRTTGSQNTSGQGFNPYFGPIAESYTRPSNINPAFGPGTWLTSESLIIANSCVTVVNTLSAAGNPGWTEVVADQQVGFVSTGGFTGAQNAPLPPSNGDLVIYDNLTDPRDDTMTWSADVSSPWWWTDAASLRYPVGVVPSGRRRSTVQWVG